MSQSRFHPPSRREFLKCGALVTVGAATAIATSSEVFAAGAGNPIVRTAEGRLRGASAAGLNIFKGVRYGEDTGGTNRFKPPTPVRPWRGIRDALQVGPPCPQLHGSGPTDWIDPKAASEDCLFLNVWAPRKPGKRAVMVFFHGGGFSSGSGGRAIHDGGKLAERGNVVVVTVTHRLNIFGYLYLGGVSPQFADSANLGQQDLVAALQWVKRNIAEFGGDPNNVTIFGESGGGGKVTVALAMPSAQGLFTKAIVESGSSLHLRTKGVAGEEAPLVFRELNIPENDSSAIYSVPAERLLAAFKTVSAAGRRAHRSELQHFSPFVDGVVVPAQPDSLESLQLWKSVPLLVGTNEDEAAYPYSTRPGGIPNPADDNAVQAELVRSWSATPSQSQQLVSAYRRRFPSDTPQQLLVAIATGFWMWQRANREAEVKARVGGAPVYVYQFGWKEHVLGGRWAIHSSELIFLFDKLDMGSLYDNDNASLARAKTDPQGLRFRLRDTMIASWAAFAKTGNPSNRFVGQWSPFTLAKHETMRLDGHSSLLLDPLGPEIRKPWDSSTA